MIGVLYPKEHLKDIYSYAVNTLKFNRNYIMLIVILIQNREELKMVKKNSRNNDLLYNFKEKASPQIYSLLIKLINEDKEDLAQKVIKIDYLLEYASSCIKQKDFEEAKEGLSKAKSRIEMLKNQEVNTEYLEYLYIGVAKKAKL